MMSRRKRRFNFIILVLVLAAGIGGGVWFLRQMPKSGGGNDIVIDNQSPADEPVKFEVTKDLAKQLVVQVIPNQYNKETAEFSIADLDGDNKAEVIITALPETQGLDESAAEAYLAVVTPTDGKGHYTKIAEFFFGKAHYLLFRSTPWIADQADIIDIEGDGEKEFVLDLGSGGASNEAFGIFKIGWEAGKIIWLQVQRASGEIENSYFLEGGSIMHRETFELDDIEKDGKIEIIEKEGTFIGTGDNPDDWQNDANWQWEAHTYKWNGNIFVYSQ